MKKRPAKKAKPSRHRNAVDPTPDGLTPAQHAFCLAYFQNGFNATRAYKTAHPAATLGTCRVEGWRDLTKPSIRAFLNPLLEEHWKPLQIGSEEALARVARIAQFDPRMLYNDQGRMLPVHQWPDQVVGCVRSMQEGPYGLKVWLESPQAALRLILEQSGKLKTVPDSVDALAAALRADLLAHKDVYPLK